MRIESDDGAAPPGGASCDGYDELPYPSMPFAYTQPAHLAALAALHGIEAPAAGTARVLELGCASGGNIIPLAARFPHAAFLGVDISNRHVDAALRRIAALGEVGLDLSNVEIRQGDLAEFKPCGAVFDYVICHGVFSWVPAGVQDAILRICGASLAENGVAAISYNVLPGWHLRSVVRDICLHYAGTELSPRQRVDKARAALERIAASASDAEPYGLLLRKEAARVAKAPSAYIHGEFLAAQNNPCHFSEFAARAGQHGLSWLCEGDLAGSISQSPLPGTGPLAGDRRLDREQTFDFVTGRPFRRSILVRSRPSVDENRRLNPGLLRQLHVASAIRLDPDRCDAQRAVFRDSMGRSIAADDPAVRDALVQLAGHYPSTQPMERLMATARRSGAAGAEARVCKAIFRLAATGRATVSSLPVETGGAAQERPRAWPLARVEAAAGQPWVTSLGHTAVPSDAALAFLLAHLDGRHNRTMLTAKLVDALQRGDVRAPRFQAGSELMSSPELDAAAGLYVAGMLDFCASQSLLERSGLASEA